MRYLALSEAAVRALAEAKDAKEQCMRATLFNLAMCALVAWEVISKGALVGSIGVWLYFAWRGLRKLRDADRAVRALNNSGHQP